VPQSTFKAHAGLGVVAAILESPRGELLLSFDDVRTGTPSDPKEWRREVHYTNAPLDAAKLKELSFSEKELADIGFSLLARLAAMKVSDAQPIAPLHRPPDVPVTRLARATRAPAAGAGELNRWA